MDEAIATLLDPGVHHVVYGVDEQVNWTSAVQASFQQIEFLAWPAAL